MLLASALLRMMMPMIWANHIWWQMIPPIRSVRDYFAAVRDYPVSDIMDYIIEFQKKGSK